MAGGKDWGLQEVAGWLAVAALGLVVGSFAAQVVQEPPPDELELWRQPAPERVARWMRLPAGAGPSPEAPRPEPAALLDLPRAEPVAADSGPDAALASPGGRGALPPRLHREVVARALLAEVRFVPRRPEAPAPRAVAPGAHAPAEEGGLLDTLVASVSAVSPDPQADSWRQVRAALADGRLPDPEVVRLEDLVNAQATTIPLPADGEPLAVDLEVAPHPWREGRHVLRLGLRAAEAAAPPATSAQPRQLTVLVDTSGSMGLESRLAQVKAGLHALLDHLGPQDRLTLVTYSDDATVRVADGDASASVDLRQVIEKLDADGASATAAALRRAGAEALQHYHPGADNRLVLVTDGEANVGMAELAEVARGVQALADRGVSLDVVAIGTQEGATAPLAELAARGRGRLLSADGFQDARRVMSRDLLGQADAAPGRFEVEVHFAPDSVAGWRLYGHEGAGSVQSLPPLRLQPGQAITALYELALTPAFLAAELDHSLGEVRLAAFDADDAALSRLVVDVPRRLLRGDFAAASRDLRVGLAAAAFGQLLVRRPTQAEPWRQVAALVGEERSEDRMLRRLVLQSGRLAQRGAPVGEGSASLHAQAGAEVDPTLLLRRVERAQESLLPCLAQGGPEGRLELGLELREGAVVDVQARLDGAQPELLACLDRTARAWRFPSTWSARLDLPLRVERRDLSQAGG